MEFNRNESGFTFVNQLFILLLIIICIPIQGAILKTLHQENSYYEELSVQQFFYLIQRDVNQAIRYNTHANGIALTLTNDDVVTFESYGELFRRQVNGMGHEIYLRDIKNVQVNPLPFGFRIQITSINGEHYEKTISFYS